MAVAYEDSLATSRVLSSSISSLSSSRHQSSQIAKAYRQSAQLYLTRRLPEALSTIEPVITPQAIDYTHESSENESATPAPIAAASRGTRIKVWSFYLTFLNSVVELGPEEGKHAFGSTKWKLLAGKCRDGSIWDEIVRVGYGNEEGYVDAEVVINLATLLLTHSPSQKFTQQKLETYLSSSSQPTFDISSHMHSPVKRKKSLHDGTSTPRDLHTRLKLLELYTLHVLPRNEEWDYAREFISMSEVLDDERKEAFLLALHGLKGEREQAEIREAEIRRQQQEQMENRRREAEAELQRLEAAKAQEEYRKKQEEKLRRPSRQELNRLSPRPTPSPRKSHPNSQRISRSDNRPPAQVPSFPQRTWAALNALHIYLVGTTQSIKENPILLLRTLLFIFAFVVAFGRQEVRGRIKRLWMVIWNKLRQTAGMGTKVSYI